MVQMSDVTLPQWGTACLESQLQRSYIKSRNQQSRSYSLFSETSSRRPRQLFPFICDKQFIKTQHSQLYLISKCTCMYKYITKPILMSFVNRNTRLSGRFLLHTAHQKDFNPDSKFIKFLLITTALSLWSWSTLGIVLLTEEGVYSSSPSESSYQSECRYKWRLLQHNL
jgi:hypothetical protein